MPPPAPPPAFSSSSRAGELVVAVGVVGEAALGLVVHGVGAAPRPSPELGGLVVLGGTRFDSIEHAQRAKESKP